MHCIFSLHPNLWIMAIIENCPKISDWNKDIGLEAIRKNIFKEGVFGFAKNHEKYLPIMPKL